MVSDITRSSQTISDDSGMVIGVYVVVVNGISDCLPQRGAVAANRHIDVIVRVVFLAEIVVDGL